MMDNSTQGNGTFTGTSPIPVHTVITLYSILLVSCLLGNVLVIAVVYCNQNLRTNMNYLIVNMAVSDLLTPLVGVPQDILWYMADGEWLVDGPLGEALCKLVPFLSHLSPYVSSISMVIIAFQRFMAVVYPTRRQIFSRKTRWIAISFPWIVSMALLSPYFYTFHLTNEEDYTMCNYPEALAAEMKLVSIAFTVGFVIPLIVIIILYAIIVHKLRQSLNNVMDLIEKETIRLRQKKNRQIFRMLSSIVVIFIICWCPFHAFYFLFLIPSFRRSFTIDIDTFHKTIFAVVYMWYLIAAINPCIYFVFLRDFRRGLKRLCCRKPTATEPIVTPPRTPDGDSNQDPTRTPPHINTTSV